MLMIPNKKRKRLIVCAPASLLSESSGLRDSTTKLGVFGRALAIYRVDKVIVYPDISYESQKKEMEFISLILRYLETPQYLRKYLFPLKEELKYAGILPPLATPQHKLEVKIKDLSDGAFREAVITEISTKKIMCDIGLKKKIKILIDKKNKLTIKNRVKRGQRITVKIKKERDEVYAYPAKREDVPEYWGYNVNTIKESLKDYVKKQSEGLWIGTSRLGDKISEKFKELHRQLLLKEKIFLVFGSPREGLKNILKRLNEDPRNLFDFYINMILEQGTRTIRVEEALHSSLAIIRLIQKMENLEEKKV